MSESLLRWVTWATFRSLGLVRELLFAVRCLSFAVRYLSFAVRCLLFAVLPSVVCRLPFCRSLFAVRSRSISCTLDRRQGGRFSWILMGRYVLNSTGVAMLGLSDFLLNLYFRILNGKGRGRVYDHFDDWCVCLLSALLYIVGVVLLRELVCVQMKCTRHSD